MPRGSPKKRRPALKSKKSLTAAFIAFLIGVAVWIATGRSPFFLDSTSRPDEPTLTERAKPPRGDFEGNVVAVLDGDTLDVLYEGKAVRVRLAGIDCPEKAQPFGAKAKKRASDIAFGRRVRVEVETVDRYGRAVARVVLPDGKSLNEELLGDGFAWWYKQYSKDARLGAMEKKAREEKRGLWAEPEPMPPWEFRRKKRR